MNEETSKSPCKCHQVIAWVITGAFLAPLLVLVTSFLQADASMRTIPVLFLIFFSGALSARIAHLFFHFLRVPGWRRRMAWIVGVAIYFLLLFFFLSLVRHVSF